MARHVTITDDQILDAARIAFLEEGFSVPTAKIAAHAGVSEGSIFKRYPTKEALFFAALRIEHPPAWYGELDSLAGIGDLKENLIALSFSMLTYFNEVLPRIVATIGNRVGPPGADPFRGLSDPLPVRDARAISLFLKNEARLGRLEEGNMECLANLLIGSLTHYVFRSHMAMENRTAEDFKALAQATIELLWNGICPGIRD